VIAIVAKQSPGADNRRDRGVAVAVVRCGVIATIAFKECARRATGAD
jgi:hypothetical protein